MKETDVIATRIYESPCGSLMLGSLGDRLCLCDWYGVPRRDRVYVRLRRLLDARFAEGVSPVLEMASRQLDEYFAGRRYVFDVPLLFAGTDFQKKVWNALSGIPYGETMSYSTLARKIGMGGAIRAVANANGANSLSIFVPCHRIIGSDGTLTGYAGGLPAKRYLLGLEATVRPL